MIVKERLIRVTESAMDSLIRVFETTPFFFYTENDLHTYLYHQIYRSFPPEDWLPLFNYYPHSHYHQSR